jgi:hypothetical protein
MWLAQLSEARIRPGAGRSTARPRTPLKNASYTVNFKFGQEQVMAPKKTTKKWVASVKTDSTHPPAGLFTKSASTIARTLASKRVSPKGAGSGMRMLTYFVNRAGRGLSASRRAKLEKAKTLLSKRIRRERERRKKAAA